MSFVHATPPSAPFLIMHMPYETDETLYGKLPEDASKSNLIVWLSTFLQPLMSINPEKLPFDREGLAVKIDLNV